MISLFHLLCCAKRRWPATCPTGISGQGSSCGVAAANQWARQMSGGVEDSDPLIVSAEAAHATARRHLGLVHIPDFLARPPNEAARGTATRYVFCEGIVYRMSRCTSTNVFLLARHASSAGHTPMATHPPRFKLLCVDASETYPCRHRWYISQVLLRLQTWASTRKHCAQLPKTSGMQRSASPPRSAKAADATPRYTSPLLPQPPSRTRAAPSSSQHRSGSPGPSRAAPNPSSRHATPLQP